MAPSHPRAAGAGRGHGSYGACPATRVVVVLEPGCRGGGPTRICADSASRAIGGVFPPGEGRREAFYKFLVNYIEVASPYSRVTTQRIQRAEDDKRRRPTPRHLNPRGETRVRRITVQLAPGVETVFVDRDRALAQLEEWAEKSTAYPVVIFGPEGCGKTAFLRQAGFCSARVRLRSVLPAPLG